MLVHKTHSPNTYSFYVLLLRCSRGLGQQHSRELRRLVLPVILSSTTGLYNRPLAVITGGVLPPVTDSDRHVSPDSGPQGTSVLVHSCPTSPESLGCRHRDLGSLGS